MHCWICHTYWMLTTTMRTMLPWLLQEAGSVRWTLRVLARTGLADTRTMPANLFLFAFLLLIPIVVVHCNKLGEAQIGWAQLPAGLRGLGFCFGQAIRFYSFFFRKKYSDEWFEYVGGLTAWGLHDFLGESVVAFQLILVSSGSGLLCQNRGFLKCMKGIHPL